MIKILVISTKTSLASLINSIHRLRKVIQDLDLKVYYTHELDEKYNELKSRLIEDILNSDIILIDIRTPTSKFIELLEERISNSRARIILPLVVGSSNLLKFLKIGKIRGSEVVKRIRDLDFDVDYIDTNHIERFLSLFEKIGKIIPVGLSRDLLNYVKAVKYWTYGTEKNLENLVRMLLREYFGKDIPYEDPREDVVPFTIWIPDEDVFINVEKYLEKYYIPHNRCVGILVYSGMHFDQCKPVAKRLYDIFRQYGYNCVIIVGGSSFNLKRQVYEIDRILTEIPVDAIVNLQWFRINGGPYGGPSEPTWYMLLKHNVILINGLIMYMREVEKWLKDSRGLSPIEVITGVALPEIDGSIEPIPLAGLSSDELKSIVLIDDRITKRVRRVHNWISIRHKDNSEKKIAIIIYNYPPGEDNVGSASYLDVFSSLENILRILHEHGYKTNVLSKEELIKKIVEKGLINSPKFISTDYEYAIKISIRDAEKIIREKLPEDVIKIVEDAWGSIQENSINLINDYMIIPGIVIGNIFIGIQPSRGIHEDPEKVYHSKDLPPHYQYLLFYIWLQDVFKADVIVHLGTHGTLELMPGKEVGLSSKCFPDILIGETPHVYVYHVTNPSEMTIAKRRSYAYIITHSTPPFTTSGLYNEWSENEELLHEYEEAKVQDPERCQIIEKLIREKCEKRYRIYRYRETP